MAGQPENKGAQRRCGYRRTAAVDDGNYQSREAQNGQSGAGKRTAVNGRSDESASQVRRED
jgi:hypothetical protein